MTDNRKISPERRREIAQKAARARWKRGNPNLSSWAEIQSFCETLASSFNLPAEYYERPTHSAFNGDIMQVAAARAAHVIQLGREVGLAPAQSIASIITRNGNTLIKGDAQLALVLKSGVAEFVEETLEGELFIENEINLFFSAVCASKRIGQGNTHIVRFSVSDAITAGLWGQPGPWTTHGPRMLKYKARAFNLRDKYPDVLKGLAHSMEEMEGEPTVRRIATDIAPAKAAEKLTGILDNRMLDNATQHKKEAHHNGEKT